MSVCWLKFAICYMCLTSHAAGYFSLHDSEYWWITTHQVRQVSDRPTYPKSQYVKQYVSNCIYIYIHICTNIFSTHTQIQINTVLTCGTPPETNIRKAENEDLDDDFGFQGDGHNSTVKMVRILSLATFSKIKSSSQIGNQINQFHSPKIRKMRSKRAFASSSSASTSHSLHSWHWKNTSEAEAIHPMLPNNLAVGTNPHLQ